MRHYALPATLLSILLAVASSGCLEQQAQDPTGPTAEQTAAAQAEYLQAEAADSTQTVVEAIAALEGGGPMVMTVVGVLGGMPNPYDKQSKPDFPWVAGEAAFFLVDPATAKEFEGDHGHAPGEECSFCLGKARDMVSTVAMVSLLDKASVVLPYQADQLLGLEEASTVQVTGRANMLADMLVIEATSIYVVPAEVEQETAQTEE